MAAIEGFLQRSLRRIKKALDEPAVNAKYSDDEYIEYVEGAYAHVLGEINRNTQHPLTVFYEVTLGAAAADQHFTLPPSLVSGMILAIKLLNSSGDVIGLMRAPMRDNPYEAGYELHGNHLRIPRNTHTENTTMRFIYAPLSCPRLHYGDAGDDSHSAAPTQAILGATPTKGILDLRANAYAGCIFRVLGADAHGITQERAIKAYYPETRQVTFWNALDPIPTTNLVYEIAPPLDSVLDTAIALQAAKSVAAIEGQFRRRRVIKEELKEMIRDIRLQVANYDSYAGLHYDESEEYQVG